MVIFLVVKFVRSESVRVRVVKLRQGERGRERGEGEGKKMRQCTRSYKP